jgi:hypothetical protein
MESNNKDEGTKPLFISNVTHPLAGLLGVYSSESLGLRSGFLLSPVGGIQRLKGRGAYDKRYANIKLPNLNGGH